MAVRIATVFGASGFIGRYVVRELARSGAQIRAAVRNPEAARFLKPMGDVGQIAPIQANIRDDGSVVAAVAGADTVINLVGVLYERGRQRFDSIHAAGAGRIARAAADAGVRRLVHVSAIGADARARAHYARSKAAGEEAVRAAFEPAIIVRPSMVFGMEDDFYNRFAWLARISPVLPLIGGGNTRFQPVYVADVAAGIMAALEIAGGAARLYEFAGPRVYTFKEIMAYVLAQTGRRRLLAPAPSAIAMIEAFFMELSPFPPLLTRDQVRLLGSDIVAGEAPGLAGLGITPTAVESIVPGYLGRYRRGGQWAGAA